MNLFFCLLAGANGNIKCAIKMTERSKAKSAKRSWKFKNFRRLSSLRYEIFEAN